MNNFFEKLPTENNEEYIKRICSKKEEIGLSWQNVADICNEICGYNYSESYYRKKYKISLVDELVGVLSNDNNEEVRNLEDILGEIRQEKQRIRDERAAANALYRRVDREQTIKEIAIIAADRISEKVILDSNGQVFVNHGDRSAILNISDWHYGIEINNYWNRYNVNEAKKRINNIFTDTINYIAKNRIAKLYVLNIGDLISGRIHAPIRIDNQEDVITQTIEVSEILAEFLNELSKCVEIEFHSVSDNHSRVEPNKKESLDLESLSRIIPWYLKTRLADNEYVTIADNKYDDDMSIFDCENWTVAMAHGDKDKLTNISSHLSLMTGKHIDLICTAHMHHFACDEVNQCMIVSNPSLMGTDTFAKNKRLTSRPAQTLILIGKTAPIEDIHYIVC